MTGTLDDDYVCLYCHVTAIYTALQMPLSLPDEEWKERHLMSGCPAALVST